MTPAELRAVMRRDHMDKIRADVDAAPPPRQDAIDLLRALNCPAGRVARVEDAA